MLSILTLNKQVCQNFFVINEPDFRGENGIKAYIWSAFYVEVAERAWVQKAGSTLATSPAMADISRQTGFKEDRIA